MLADRIMHGTPFPISVCLAVSVLSGDQPAGDCHCHLAVLPGHHLAPTHVSVASFPASALHQPKEMPRCTPEGRKGLGLPLTHLSAPSPDPSM